MNAHGGDASQFRPITIVTRDLASGKILLLELLTKVHSALLHVAYVHWKVAINFISMDPPVYLSIAIAHIMLHVYCVVVHVLDHEYRWFSKASRLHSCHIHYMLILQRQIHTLIGIIFPLTKLIIMVYYLVLRTSVLETFSLCNDELLIWVSRALAVLHVCV